MRSTLHSNIMMNTARITVTSLGRKADADLGRQTQTLFEGVGWGEPPERDMVLTQVVAEWGGGGVDCD